MDLLLFFSYFPLYSRFVEFIHVSAASSLRYSFHLSIASDVHHRQQNCNNLIPICGLCLIISLEYLLGSRVSSQKVGLYLIELSAVRLPPKIAT